ncbi:MULTISPECIES: MarR family winged helix-turn-helix transcriptional regulator [unclassified Leifsonia]|uniref:MarR family winged helix-turn-helix transcriptional regulator n=1 Tax=unclassified Leifsonia TaxID=2663824 RepID=UPI0006FADF58|nr:MULTISPECIES: MarR family transcriptional regulator [unclassified Leifsonia]KQX05072.1 hypothetical protein ASC59_12670 [Leifsonia sp. Root1293]KRA08704.1 hypothetical protein ASD61_12670 [Leifsonia sp. Root60]
MSTAEPSVADVDEAWSSFQRLRTQLTGRINRELTQSTGLSEADFDILFALDESEDKSLRALALRCGLDWEKSRLSHQLRRMESRGLVAKEACIEDARGTTIVLTDAGRAAIAAARDCHAAAVSRYFGEVLSAEQLAALSSISSAVLERLAEDAPEPVHGK